MVYLSRPDFGLLDQVVPKDVRSSVLAGLSLVGQSVDLIVVHRDADNAGPAARRREIEGALQAVAGEPALVPVIPVRMTEAWLMLDETAIRRVAGNPRGKAPLDLPKAHEVEGNPDPKARLRQCIMKASEATGRRRDAVHRRFSQHRRQLLEVLDRTGAVSTLPSWCALVADIASTVENWKAPQPR